MDVNPQNQEGMSELWAVGANGEEARRLHPGDALQPSWSPHKRRIAFAARRLGAARGADLWTISVGGGPATAVTADPSFDWNPIWSPDGQHLYFASDRSGTMNLWRIAIDEETGESRGQPEPITTPAGFIAHPSMSADGRLLAYSAVLMVTNIQRLAFDPAAAAVSGEPVWVTTGSRLWANPDPSPDGQSIVFYSRVEPEGDLYLTRADGTGQRQLTSDAALDRMPRWSPDGMWIQCFSDRSGELQVWKIRPDGSDLQQVTDGADSVAYGTWSPDSSRLAVASVVGTGGRSRAAYVIDPDKRLTQQQPDRLPPAPGSSQLAFTPNSWSPDGERLVGQLGLTPGVLTYTFNSRSYERLTDFGEWPVWLPDSRRVLFGDGGKNFWVLDVLTRQTKAIYSGGRDVLGPPRLTRDGKTVYYSRRVSESDIWLMTLK
jgi:Tol biopolymer transport system component